MSAKLKLYLGRKILDSLKTNTTTTAPDLVPLFEINASKQERNVQMCICLTKLEKCFGILSLTLDIPNRILKIQPDDIIKNIHTLKDSSNKKICFDIDRTIFVKEIVENAKLPDLNKNPKRIVVEFSSPNVAKPFHVGHLRSTIIGNFIANLHSHVKNQVTRLNYLGDWGTQFGLIKVGVEELKYSSEDIKKNPLQLLYNSYVHANKLSSSDKSIIERARREFAKLESGTPDDIANWKTYITYTISELQVMYNRLGVRFDEYNYESMYNAKHINDVLTQLDKMKILKTNLEGKQIARVNDRDITVIKSDGTTLYLTRDIAAAMDRYTKYQFDKMYYVVENGQNDHFDALKGILRQMNLPWADKIKHIKFGRIHGMSTRRGKVVFLKDILDETRDLMVQRQLASPTTKVPIKASETSDVLGISCVIVNDLKQRRQRDYTFSWERALQVQGDSGIKLQYTHCRLCSLEKLSGAIAATSCIPDLLPENVVTDLVKELGRFQDVLYKTEEQLEACILVSYLFHLCNHINKALKILKVKNQEHELASQRLLLFNTSRDILKQGMTILGLKPLSEM